MAEQAEFTVTEEQRELRTALHRFCERAHDEATVRRLMASDDGFDRALWARLGGELGALSLAVPEELGGAGGTVVDQAVAAEELGAALVTGPLLGTVGLAIPALVAAPASGTRDALLADLAAGTRTGALVAGLFAPYDGATAAAVTAAGGTLSGEIGHVPDAAAADVLLVAADGPDGPVLACVEPGVPGVTVTGRGSLDPTRRIARVRLDGAAGTVLATGDDADRALQHAFRTAGALLAAEQVGIAARLLELTVGYATQRWQFGRPIGSFQAVKHRLADMLVGVEQARTAALHAAWAIVDPRLDDPDLAVAIAQATCSEVAYRAAADTVQLHGGIGFTWEHPAHLYYKRAIADAALLGSAEEYRERIAAAVLDTLPDDLAVPRVATG
ncbi:MULTISPECIES: acyl-CoA dehydrogenase family protein [Pseudonocardia]|uniref:Acyl-CoA dehydrogenase n=2 Tax=Pseudonocardia TaxID=1847 RepID=A0A1Y2N5Y7_PSEAH|nr:MULTISPECIES: acyl-CoA dehydrogenase family protein [Pseudonocardia]OSY42875.1 Acyl-CoA dehydrogenase [Pseudonocardia autotrophica]TDN77453.1 alkylation response protein AidB-like acyl-CoA dehydrogenase [Pseudonocardia autotrophica]BBG01475.1 acyl-CoA dehydrogenase [Pseudonocardia autotrophica]GEC25259.1 acyl-CoA dehydrogenase [Pseudonocardia saturnea]